MLREAQYANSPSDPEHKKLVNLVFERRGSAPEIRAAIETDCIGERQRAADTAAAIAALQKNQEATSAGAGVGAEPSVGTSRQNAVVPTPVSTVRKNDSAAQCANLNRELSTLQALSRQGGSIAAMEKINAQRRDIDSKISAAKC